MYGWRATTIDVDLKPDPEPQGLFEVLAQLKDELDINVKLSAPDHFIPALSGWPERSLFIARHGQIDFFHYDPYGQALSKLQRRHDRDIQDVRSSLRDGLIRVDRLREMFAEMESNWSDTRRLMPPRFALQSWNFVMKTAEIIAGLPGEEIVRKGLADLQSGKCTVAACLAAIARPRLDRAGLISQLAPDFVGEPELQLYRLLRQEGGDAYHVTTVCCVNWSALNRRSTADCGVNITRSEKQLKATNARLLCSPANW